MSPVHTKRQQIQLCYPFSESRLLNKGRLQSQWSSPYLIQPKLNGERCRALVSPEGRCLLFSSSAELITTLPHITHQMSNFPPGEYDGELYVHGWTFSEIHSAVSTTMSIHPRASEMEYHIFDIISEDIQGERLNKLISIFDHYFYPSIHLVPTYPCTSLSEIMSYYDTFISQFFEGFVLKEISSLSIRRRSPYWMKFKPKQTDIYDILEIKEAVSESGEYLGMVGAFLCVDSEGTEFKVGAGKLSHAKRKEIWEGYVPLGSRLLVEYQTLSDSKGVPHFSRAVKILPPFTSQEVSHG